MKTCKKCNQTKPLSDFGRDKNRVDGLNIYCRECIRSLPKSTKKLIKSECVMCSKEFKTRISKPFCGIKCDRLFHKEAREIEELRDEINEERDDLGLEPLSDWEFEQILPLLRG